MAKQNKKDNGSTAYLTPAEIISVRRHVYTFGTQEEAAKSLNISKGTLIRILGMGKGSPATIEKVRAAIN